MKITGSRVRSMLAAAVLLGSASSASAAGKCQLSKLVELPISFTGLRPILVAGVNGTDARFLLDSGAFFSLISSATAAQFKLRESPAPHGLRIEGIGGSTDASIATVKQFTLAGIPLHNVEFLVGGSEVGSNTVGLLGQNFLEKWEVEYDFGKGVVTLFEAKDCKHANLAYWSGSTEPLSIIDIGYTDPRRPHTTADAFVNGTKVRVMFDTGAWTSMLSLHAAARAGIHPGDAGTVEAGYVTGIGRGSAKSYIARVASFKLGDEEIKNTRMRIADINLNEGDMLLGSDFFLAHRIFVSNSTQRLFFTYNGGVVFNLSANANNNANSSSSSDAAGTASPATDSPAATAPDPSAQFVAGEPADAAAYARRGAAFRGRRDFQHALSDLNRACELAPNEPQYFYERGEAYWESGQPKPAMSDFDRALELNADYLPAHIRRAELHLANKEKPQAVDDMNAAERIAPKEADVRFTLAELYERAELPAPEIAQFDLWIAAHPDDSKMSRALNGRCWVRALQGQDLADALSDCNAALRRTGRSGPGAGAILDSRGLVRLRLGDYDKAIRDYDDSLKIMPKNAWSLYGRGIAKIRAKKSAEGQADLAAATANWPAVAAEFQRHGMVP